MLATVLALSTIASAASADTLVFYTSPWFAASVTVTDDHGTSITKTVVPNNDTRIEVEGNWTVKAYTLSGNLMGEASKSGDALFELRRTSFDGGVLRYVGTSV